MTDQSGRLTSSARAVAAFRARKAQQARAVGLNPPIAWQTYEPAILRLPGLGGSGLFLRTSVFPGVGDSNVLAVDVGLLTVEQFQWFFSRGASPGYSLRLSEFFISLAGDESPELMRAPFTDDELDLRIDVVSSDVTEVELLIRVDADHDLTLQTTRSAVMQAGLDVRRLERLDADAGLDWL